MMKFLLTLLSIAVMAAGFAADPVKLPPKEKFLLVLLAGQSNMAGRGFVQDSDKIPSPRVVMLDKEGNWVPAVDPVHYDKKAAGVGPGRTFAHLLAATDPEITVGLIPTACGGSPISSWVPGGYWEQTKSHPYDDAIARARKAMESGTLTVLLWHQGEADCGKENSKLYHDRFSELVKRFRRDLGAPELPVIVGQLSKFPNKPWWDGKKQVDAAQRAVVEELPPAAFVPSDGLTSNPDIVHFDAASQREFGKRYFEAYRKLLEKENAKK